LTVNEWVRLGLATEHPGPCPGCRTLFFHERHAEAQMTQRKPQHGGIPPSIASLEMIARARRSGLAQAMEDMLSEPHRPDPRDASVEEPQRLSRLRGPFFAALWELRIVEHIAVLAQPPKDWRRREFIDAVQRLIWVATVRVSVRHRARTKLDAKGMTNALAAVLRARGALQQLGWPHRCSPP
jgi:hypothetical protein